MANVDHLFHKWQGWIHNELLTEFRNLLRDRRIFHAYLESLNPFVGHVPGEEIAAWMGLNYFASACVAIRRLDDADKRSVSLRGLLTDLRKHADLLTEDHLAAHNPLFRKSPDRDPNTGNEMGEVLGKEIELLDGFGNKIKIYVNKFVAHRDADGRTDMIPKSEVLEKAIFCYHTLYRKYAFAIGGIPCNFNNPDPLDLMPAPSEDYKARLTRLWQP